MNVEPLETAEGAGFEGCRQLNVFLENRVGQLLRITRLFERQPIRILGLSVEGKVDCALLRMLVNDPDAALELCRHANLPVSQSEVLVVELPPGKRGIMTICAALISSEVNINYAYTVWATERNKPCLAIQVDSLIPAVRVLHHRQFCLVAQHEL
jgi:hypothetical protein